MRIPANGPLSARLAIIGGFPLRQQPFAFGDYGGDLLFKLLPIERGSCYTDYVRPEFIPDRKFLTRKDIEELRPALKERLSRLDANCFLALGWEALFALTGQESIEKYRGSTIPSTLIEGKKVSVAWDPNEILKGQYERRYVFDLDLRKAADQANYPQLNKRDFEFLLDPSAEEFEQFIGGLEEDVSVDIECPIRAERVLYCVGLSSHANRACCLPFVGGTQTTTELRRSAQLLQKEVFQKRNIIGQNIAFDVDKLEAFGFRIRHIKHCTMLAHHLLWPEAGTKQKEKDTGKDGFAGGHDLGFLVSFYTDQPYHKDEGTIPYNPTREDWIRYWTYNCKDVALTYEIFEREIEELVEFGQLEYFQEHVMGLVRPVMRMQQRGLKVDFSKLSKVSARIAKERTYLQLKLNQTVGFDINVKSPTQMRYLIQDVLHLKSTKRTKKGAVSTDEETLRNLAYGSTDAAPIFNDIIEVRKRRTLESSFLQLEASQDGRYRAVYKIHGTDSGRLACSSSKDLDGRKGPQLQNIPKSTRVLFVAEPGCAFLLRDLTRAEAMFVAYDAQEEFLIRVFEDRTRDFYIEYAQASLGRTIEKKSIERECFKQGVHSANYGVGPKRLVGILRLKGINIEDLSIRGISAPLKKAEFILQSYYQLCPGIPAWQKETIARAQTDRTLHDAFGRRRFFMGDFRDTHTHRVVLSYKPQATITGITNRAIRILDAQGYRIVLQVHDSLGLEVEFAQFEQALEDTEKALYYPITLHGRTFAIPCDLGWGFSWGELNESRVLASELPTLYREKRSA